VVLYAYSILFYNLVGTGITIGSLFNLQSQERARKLRADLAVEEHRGLELSRILKEVLPHPKMSNVQKPRAGRKVHPYFFFLHVWLSFKHISLDALKSTSSIDVEQKEKTVKYV
jgi:hypothetical protein